MTIFEMIYIYVADLWRIIKHSQGGFLFTVNKTYKCVVHITGRCKKVRNGALKQLQNVAVEFHSKVYVIYL